jgi:hypothetical protein
MSEPNKKDGVFSGETRTITRPDPASIKAGAPQTIEPPAKTRFVRGQPTNVL